MDWKGKKVLVTGGTGFIGSFLVERLLDRGAHVRVPLRAQNYRALSEKRSQIEWMEGDLRDPAFVAQLIDGVDHIFHLASCRRNVAHHHEHAGGVMAENVRMAAALLEAHRENPKVPITFFSTANIPADQSLSTILSSEKIDGYVWGKIACEMLFLSAAKERGFPLLIVRPVGVYGPRDTFSLDGNVIPSLLLKARDNAKELTVWGSGMQERSFLYVEDLADAVLALLDAGAMGIQFISSSDVVTIKTLAEKIRDLINPDLKLTFDTSKAEGARSLPQSPLHPSLHDFLWTDLSKGLDETVKWWKHLA